MKYLVNAFLLTIVFEFFPLISNAQSNVVLRADGSWSAHGLIEKNDEVRPIPQNALEDNFTDLNRLTDKRKIVFYDLPNEGNSDFGFWGQDWILQWFEAPTDMIINRVGINCSSKESDELLVRVKLVNLNWSKEEILNAGEKNLGYYEAEGNGFNNITAFSDNRDRTGDWVEVDGLGKSPFAKDLWSDAGLGAPLELTPSGIGNTWNWVDLSSLGWKPDVQAGDIIGVAVKNVSENFDQDRIGLMANNKYGANGFKFYSNGRFTPGGVGEGDCGWWSRGYTWDMALDVTFTGKPPTRIMRVSRLQTTISTEAREVKARIITDDFSGNKSIEKVDLVYRTNGGEWENIPMTSSDRLIYTGNIPEQEPGTEIEYYVTALNSYDMRAVAPIRPVSYKIFKQNYPHLLIFNGGEDDGYPYRYYFGPNFAWQNPLGSYLGFDVWAYGPLPMDEEFLEHYDIIYEICHNGPEFYTNDPAEGAGIGKEMIRDWLANASHRDYFLSGMEWLGAWNDFQDVDFKEGDFAYDILGISHSYNNIAVDGSLGEEKPTAINLEEDSELNDNLIYAGAENLQFDPMYETTQKNKMDAFEVTDEALPFITAISRSIGGVPAVEEHPCAVYNETPNGNKIVFISYDPIAINSNPDGDYGNNYIWWGFEEANHPYSVAVNVFFTIADPKKNKAQLTEKFQLSQNYPNPLIKGAGISSTTIIKFTIPEDNFVTLKIYDVLGREVSSDVVNKRLSAGSYEVGFNASGLAAGMYIYQLKAGNYVKSKKMLLLR